MDASTSATRAEAEADAIRDEIRITEFARIGDLVRHHASQRPHAMALRDDTRTLSWAALDAAMDRVAARLQQEGLGPGRSIAICASSSTRYAVVFLGALRAGVAVAPLSPGSTAQSLTRMVLDAEVSWLFLDPSSRGLLDGMIPGLRRVALDDDPAADEVGWSDWLVPEGTRPLPATIEPSTAFNIIYSSGTTGEPKGIVQGHGMRWGHVRRVSKYGYGPDTVTLLATPLYSNTTLVVFFPTIAYGGCTVLMSKFDAGRYLALSQELRVTHTMLVPVQYQRLLAHPDFEASDLSSFRAKFCTSAPFSASLKADVLRRWPGGLVEFYGMTEGGGTCILDAHLHPGKLHTVGQPAEGSDIRLIDEEEREAEPGQSGEVVGRSASMMTEYHGQLAKTREAEWFDASGQRFIRTGDVGRFDSDGFLILQDRRKDMIISGGFNLYPSDLEAVLLDHPLVTEAAVIGVPSVEWGETPVGFVVPRDPKFGAEAIRTWANARLGKTQRLSRVVLVAELPRNAIGKVLKRELRAQLIVERPTKHTAPSML